MLSLEARKYLFDIVQATDLLTRFTSGRTLVDYGADALLRAAVERQFEIIGQAPPSKVAHNSCVSRRGAL